MRYTVRHEPGELLFSLLTWLFDLYYLEFCHHVRGQHVHASRGRTATNSRRVSGFGRGIKNGVAEMTTAPVLNGDASRFTFRFAF